MRTTAKLLALCAALSFGPGLVAAGPAQAAPTVAADPGPSQQHSPWPFIWPGHGHGHGRGGGVRGYEVVSSDEITIPNPGPNVVTTHSVRCPDRKRVLGGGADITPVNPAQGELISSRPSNNGRRWTVTVRGASTVTVYAVCAFVDRGNDRRG